MTRSPNVTDLSVPEPESDAEPRVVDFTDEEVDDLFGALASSTARELLQQLHDSPMHPAALADETDMSIQNIHYHLSKLENAGIVTVVDTTYSKKGREMEIYAPAAEPLVMVSGNEDGERDFVEALSKFLAGVGGLALGSVFVQKLVEWLFYPGGPQPLADATGEYAAPPVTNVAPPIGLFVFFLGLCGLLVWLAQRQL